MNASPESAFVSETLAALAEYRRRGFAPLPVKFKGKAPAAGTDWQNFQAADDSLFIGKNIGNILGIRSGNLVDVDLDCQEAIALAMAILPPTGAIFGRKSKPRSHWLYVTEEPIDTAQFQTKQDGMLVELRSTGCQTVFPPSIHTTGEEIKWSGNFGEPARLDGQDLLRRVSALAAISLLVRHWPEETGRYNAEGALIGTLLRAGWPEEEAEKLLNLIRARAGEAPRHPLGKIIPRLAARLTSGKSVTGLKRLSELLGEEVATKTAEWLKLKKPKPKTSYEMRDGGTFHTYLTADGEPRESRLSNFSAEITRVVERDDGSGFPERTFVVESGPDRAEIPAAEFDSMGWVTAEWGPLKSITPGRDAKGHLAEAIKTNSADVEFHTIYTHTGWIESDGQHLYLHAEGAIGRSGAVEGFSVELSGKLKNYVLPPLKDIKLAVRASLSMRELGPIGILMLAAVYRAPLAEFLELTNSVFVEGKTGTFKSAVQGVALSHWGAHWDGVQFPVNWTGTANSLEKVAYSLKDALCVVDDFKPSGPAYEVEKLHQTAERVLRAAANHGGRSRMNADSSLRNEYFPRGMVMSSGEDIPKGHSLRARIVLHRVEKGDIDPTILTRLQQQAAEGLMAEAMAGYVQYLAGKASASLREELRENHRRLRQEITGDHSRTPGNIASLLIGIDYLAAFACECGAISDEEATCFRADARASLIAQAKVQDDEQATEDPCRRFIELLSEALAARRVHLATRQGDAPPGLEVACGWRERQLQESIDWQPSGDGIGWIENNTVYLRSAVAYAAAERLSKEQNRSLGVTKETLLKRLVAAGWIEKSITVRAQDVVNRVYPMKADLVLSIQDKDGLPERTLAFINAARRLLPFATGGLHALAERAIEVSQTELWESIPDPAEKPM